MLISLKKKPKKQNVKGNSVTLFIFSLNGGAGKIMINLARGLARRDIKVDLLFARAEKSYLAQIPPEVNAVPLKAAHVPTCFFSLYRYLKREKPAVMLSTVAPNNLVALWAQSLSGVSTRLVVREAYHVSCQLEHASKVKSLLMTKLIRRFYPRADNIIAISRSVARDIAQITNLPPERIRTVYNPVVTPELAAKAREPLKHPWFDPGQPPVVIGVGRLSVEKDFSTLIRAFARVREQRRTRLLILGDGVERPRLESLIYRLGLVNDVSLPGFAENPYAYMARAKVLVLSSIWEGFGNVLIEAMACGTPVVSTDCKGGPGEILEQGKYGRLVPVGNADLLAEAILHTMDAPPDRDYLKARAAHFSLQSGIEKYWAVLCDEKQESFG